jgi:gamma-glutamylcyclotransferase (GGCT)/AIG2-like uncharacterized protein YtfP
MKNLFAYGTLMCDDIMGEVSGFRLSHTTGTLKGYTRRAVKGEHYPALLPDDKDRVEGVAYLDVPESAWHRLDRFEGEMYERLRVEITLGSGATLHAETYVVKPEFLIRLEPHGWDFAEFLGTGKTSFQRHYRGYRSLEEKHRDP